MTVAKELSTDSDLTARSGSRDGLVALLAICIFALLSSLAAIYSEGFLEADACTHYLYARFAFEQPHYFINIWGRPICTAIYSLPAVLGSRLGVRFMSLALAIGCGLVAMRIARNQNYRWPVLALIFTLAQPLVFLHSFSELTELPFAFLLGLGFLAYQARRWVLMSILIGLTPLSRPEGFGFIALAFLAIILHRRWWCLLILPIPLLLWDYIGWVMYGSTGPWWRWLPANWPYSPKSLYLPGPLLFWSTRANGEMPASFLLRLPVVVSPFLLPFFFIGVWKGVSKKIRGLDWQAHCQMLITLIPLAMLLGHSFLWWRGLMASNGELRYMLIAAPFWAMISAKGWEWVWMRLHLTAPLRMAGIAVLLPIFANSMYRVIPIKLYGDSIPAKQVVSWYQQSQLAKDFPRLATAFVEIYYYMDIAPTDRDRSLEWHRDRMAKPLPGTIVIWDPVYAVYNSDDRRKVPLEDLIRDGWVDVTEHVPSITNGWRVLLSPQDIRGSDTRSRSSW